VIKMLFASENADVSGYAASKKLVSKPGDKWYYSSGTSNIISRTCTARLGLLSSPTNPVETKTWLGTLGRFFWPSMLLTRFLYPSIINYSNPSMLSYLEQNVFHPIGMKETYPQFDSAGVFIGSSFVFATARDFARFGLLYLRDGMWDGKRLLPEGWAETARQTTAVNPTPGALFDYGAHWWIPKEKHAERGWFSANGYEGQMIVVVPSLDLVVVRLGRTGDEKGFERVFEEVVGRAVECFE
jgi:CubicO group peptidase (beta-lactamase class C family)